MPPLAEAAWEEIWGAFVLVLTLSSAGLVALLVLAPLIFETPPPGLVKARRGIVVLVGLTVVLLVLEYVVFH